MPTAYERLLALIRKRRARVAVIGLGYVGLPLAVRFAEAGFKVTGYDLDPRRIGDLRRGKCYIPDVPAAAIRALLKAGRLSVTGRGEPLSQAQVIVICVPTPLQKSREPDLSFICSAVETVAEQVKPPALVILESTTTPGTTDGMVREKMEAVKLKMDRDIFLAFSPERIDPGNALGVKAIPKLVGGVTPQSTRLAHLFYSQSLDRVIAVSSSRVAETAKLLENTFRIINIALANEFALLCNAIGVDVWEVIDAAGSKPFGFMPFYPGPGIGGHCIPSDPIYLSWHAKSAGFEPRMIDLASQINSQMPEHVVSRVADLLNAESKPIKSSKILQLGVAYKRNINDTRDSPALEILGRLSRKGARVAYHDPHVAQVRGYGKQWRSVPLTRESVRSADCVVIATDHQNVDYKMVAKEARLIFDARNVMQAIPHRRSKVERL
ncbi:MAG: nucleotide sugar dehydrogenase [Candidatus Omnitrophica bacterium]|nr:nucleotide sugar dehydrogenase [Candidatus Omnitrophota bacterium]